jgi:hypothetical protein
MGSVMANDDNRYRVDPTFDNVALTVNTPLRTLTVVRTSSSVISSRDVVDMEDEENVTSFSSNTGAQCRPPGR